MGQFARESQARRVKLGLGNRKVKRRPRRRLAQREDCTELYRVWRGILSVCRSITSLSNPNPIRLRGTWTRVWVWRRFLFQANIVSAPVKVKVGLKKTVQHKTVIINRRQSLQCDTLTSVVFLLGFFRRAVMYGTGAVRTGDGAHDFIMLCIGMEKKMKHAMVRGEAELPQDARRGQLCRSLLYRQLFLFRYRRWELHLCCCARLKQGVNPVYGNRVPVFVLPQYCNNPQYTSLAKRDQ